jgi:glyoxylase-like metal-dependent hydrolase (beta-lactamase superfamily II)
MNRTLQIGAATVTVITLVDDLQVDLKTWLQQPEDEWPRQYRADITDLMRFPIQSVHIALPGASILVDACDVGILAETPFAPPGYQPPPDIVARLNEIGVSAEEITHVIITHAHFDHYSGIVRLQEDCLALCFPNAKHYLGRADFEAFTDLSALPAQPFVMLQQRGQLELVDNQLDLGNGVQMIAAPGETSGHQIVRVHSEGTTFYCLGDLYHHPVEVMRPEWTVHWSNPKANRRSRQALTRDALAEDALLMATHIPTLGRLRREVEGVIWEMA